MIIYNVTVKIDSAHEEAWLQWMRSVHIPDVMKTGFFVDHKIYRLLDTGDADGSTYAIQYFCNNMEDYTEYRRSHAPRLQGEHAQKFGSQTVAFRTLMQQI